MHILTQGPARPSKARGCDQLGVCQLHATGKRGCPTCPYAHIPGGQPHLALLGAVERKPTRRRGLRRFVRNLLAWLGGPTP